MTEWYSTLEWTQMGILLHFWLVQSVRFILALTAHLCPLSLCLSLCSSPSVLGSGRSERRCPLPPPCPFSPRSARLRPICPPPPLAPEEDKQKQITDQILIYGSNIELALLCSFC